MPINRYFVGVVNLARSDVIEYLARDMGLRDALIFVEALFREYYLEGNKFVIGNEVRDESDS